MSEKIRTDGGKNSLFDLLRYLVILICISYTKANKELWTSFFPAFFAYEVNGFAG